jgi:hypothetical protein
MDIQPQTTKPISDDQELAKVLAGVSQETNNNLVFEEGLAPQPVEPEVEQELAQQPVQEQAQTESDELFTIKNDALTDLCPLVEKLDLLPEEKFDIYLMLLRSTDDKTLIPSAYIAARNIAEEIRRAQALLDIIKEIDYLSASKQEL